MIDTITRLFGHQISSETFDAKFGQAVCFIAAGVFCLVSFWKLTRLELNEAQFFLGVLLSLCVPLLLFILGLLLPLPIISARDRSQPKP